MRLAIAKAARVLRARKSAHTSLFDDSNVAVKLNAGKIHARLFTVWICFIPFCTLDYTNIQSRAYIHISKKPYTRVDEHFTAVHMYNIGTANGTERHGTFTQYEAFSIWRSVCLFRFVYMVLSRFVLFVCAYLLAHMFATLLRHFSNYHHLTFIVVSISLPHSLLLSHTFTHTHSLAPICIIIRFDVFLAFCSYILNTCIYATQPIYLQAFHLMVFFFSLAFDIECDVFTDFNSHFRNGSNLN